MGEDSVLQRAPVGTPPKSFFFSFTLLEIINYTKNLINSEKLNVAIYLFSVNMKKISSKKIYIFSKKTHLDISNTEVRR